MSSTTENKNSDHVSKYPDDAAKIQSGLEGSKL